MDTSPASVQWSPDGLFTEICRTCLSETAGCNLFTNDTGETSLKTMVEALTGLQVSPEDKLPQHICNGCVNSIQAAYVFCTNCQRIDGILQCLLKQMKTTPASCATNIDEPRVDLDRNNAAHNLTVRRRFNCQQCSKTFLMKTKLINHLKMHRNKKKFHFRTKRKTYMCHSCGIMYISKKELLKHFKTHGEEQKSGNLNDVKSENSISSTQKIFTESNDCKDDVFGKDFIMTSKLDGRGGDKADCESAEITGLVDINYSTKTALTSNNSVCKIENYIPQEKNIKVSNTYDHQQPVSHQTMSISPNEFCTIFGQDINTLPNANEPLSDVDQSFHQSKEHPRQQNSIEPQNEHDVIVKKKISDYVPPSSKQSCIIKNEFLWDEETLLDKSAQKKCKEPTVESDGSKITRSPLPIDHSEEGTTAPHCKTKYVAEPLNISKERNCFQDKEDEVPTVLDNQEVQSVCDQTIRKEPSVDFRNNSKQEESDGDDSTLEITKKPLGDNEPVFDQIKQKCWKEPSVALDITVKKNASEDSNFEITIKNEPLNDAKSLNQPVQSSSKAIEKEPPTIKKRSTLKPNVRYTCAVTHCKKMCKYPLAIMNHYISKHKMASTPFKCPVCENIINKQMQVHTHVQSHVKPEYKCPHCSEVHETIENYKSHIQIHKDKKLFKCPKIPAKLRVPHNNVSIKSYHSSIECSDPPCVCPKVYQTDANLRFYTCLWCHKVFRTQDILDGHLELHLNEHECKFCKERFYSSTDMFQHVRNLHVRRSYGVRK